MRLKSATIYICLCMYVYIYIYIHINMLKHICKSALIYNNNCNNMTDLRICESIWPTLLKLSVLRFHQELRHEKLIKFKLRFRFGIKRFHNSWRDFLLSICNSPSLRLYFSELVSDYHRFFLRFLSPLVNLDQMTHAYQWQNKLLLNFGGDFIWSPCNITSNDT